MEAHKSTFNNGECVLLKSSGAPDGPADVIDQDEGNMIVCLC